MAYTDQANHSTFRNTADKLQDTVKNCLPSLLDEPDGIETRNLLNKVRSRGYSPSDREFKQALSKLKSDQIAKRLTRKGVERWALLR